MICKHGRLARSCVVCGLERDLVECAHGWAACLERERVARGLLEEVSRRWMSGVPNEPGSLDARIRAFLASPTDHDG